MGAPHSPVGESVGPAASPSNHGGEATTALSLQPSGVGVLNRIKGRLIHANFQVIGIYLALALAWLIMAIVSPYFFTVANIRNIFIASSTLSLVAAGLTVVMIAGEIDLSFAALEAFAASLAAVFIIQFHMPWVLGALAAVALSVLAGVISAVVAIVARLHTFITTLAMMGIVQGVAFLLTGGQPVADFPNAYQKIGVSQIGVIPVAVIIAVVAYAILHVGLTRSVWGLRVFAVGGNRTAALRAGISRPTIVISALALSGLLAGIAGVILSARLNAGSGDYGSADLLPAIAAVFIGGTSLSGGVGSLAGTAGGIILIETIYDALTFLNVSEYWQQIAVGVIILLAVVIDKTTRQYLRSGGLDRLGRRERPSRQRASGAAPATPTGGLNQ